jgi:translocation and assembly module TamB
MTVAGPYDAPVISLTSAPPLPREDLLLLLLAGRSPALRGGRQPAKLGMNVAVYLGRNFLTNLFGATSERSGGDVLDRFQVEIGRQVSRSGEATVDADFLLAKGLFGKDDVLSLTSGKDVYDDYNLGLRLVFRLP